VPVQLEIEKRAKGFRSFADEVIWSETLEERTPTLERCREDEVAAPALD
jgi:hypothetical protein